ncbi:hypothetical protein ACVWXN_000220 [Bradyrhizobium sp. i1.4.4]|uniref:DUF6894 domain-containing protein n=1 Tax=Bradyrhizobium japonicum TaxID=375 RepID=A0A1Y2JR51_BRAJP|nr:hypothetical protein [Bradyrhizobium japonicum]OSJ33923.1 hypothetical protein BSZ19_14135 [Bradyrhizobium japonicum]
MTRYYFHVLDGTAVADEIGEEFSDIHAAKAEAVKLASGILADGLGETFWQGHPWQIVVRDSASPERGRIFFSLTLSAQE